MVAIAIPNMACGGCAKGVLATLRGAAGDAAPRVDLARRELRLETGDVAALVAALRADGWDATAVAS